MPADPWFVSDDPETELELGPDERVFTAALRERASAWPVRTVPPAVSWVAKPEDDSLLVACVGLGDGPNGWPPLVGLHLTGSALRGDHLDEHFYWLPEPRTPLALDATGTPRELAALAADWFERVLRMRVVRQEWYHRGRRYADRCLFADHADGPFGRYVDGLAPPECRGGAGVPGRPDRVVVLREAQDRHPGPAARLGDPEPGGPFSSY
ncbi:hypothetical protein ACR3S4_09280 [Streptomyces sp. CH8.1]|uniref:hypothetical protein n=1 Tax=Streptomyces TaxID=1883 RepID=UPI0004BD746A|nr:MULTISPECIES: hypothetical protein [Streptomyces]KOU15865.1 hypothetical protein ADK49_19505 [Streptomyces sp. WM6349]KOV41773.1 hypothetical protein ADK98_25930 [Streptomyces sp. H036]RST07110.1 hypothetical protein EF904_17415 [Streptomyces sp. WAC05950]